MGPVDHVTQAFQDASTGGGAGTESVPCLVDTVSSGSEGQATLQGGYPLCPSS